MSMFGRSSLVRYGRTVAVAVLLSTGVVGTAAAAVDVRVLALQSGWRAGRAEAINERGVVVGTAIAPEGMFHAVRWDRAGRVTDLGLVPGGGGYTRGFAINDDGAVLGDARTGDGYHAVRWDPAGRIEVLATPQGGWIQPVGITGGGIAAATAYGTTAGTRGMVWNRDGVPTVLAPLPGGTYSEVRAMSEDGMAVGLSNTPDSFYTVAVRWDHLGRPSTYPVLPGHVTASVQAVNETGTAIGVSIPLEGAWHAVSWDRHGRITDLGEFRTTGDASGINRRGTVIGVFSGLDEPRRAFVAGRGEAMTVLPIPPDTASSDVSDINDRGEIVGGVLPPGSYTGRPVWWDRRGRVAALPVLPDSASTSAMRINDHGTIIGSMRTVDGEYHAVVWHVR